MNHDPLSRPVASACRHTAPKRQLPLIVKWNILFWRSSLLIWMSLCRKSEFHLLRATKVSKALRIWYQQQNPLHPFRHSNISTFWIHCGFVSAVLRAALECCRKTLPDYFPKYFFISKELQVFFYNEYNQIFLIVAVLPHIFLKIYWTFPD